jgi:hypothetical protein
VQNAQSPSNTSHGRSRRAVVAGDPGVSGTVRAYAGGGRGHGA